MDEHAGRPDPLTHRILEVIYGAQTGRSGRGVELADIVDSVTRGAIARRIAPDRQTVVSALAALVQFGYLRVDRWSKYRITPRGWTEILERRPEDFPWAE